MSNSESRLAEFRVFLNILMAKTVLIKKNDSYFIMQLSVRTNYEDAGVHCTDQCLPNRSFRHVDLGWYLDWWTSKDYISL